MFRCNIHLKICFILLALPSFTWAQPKAKVIKHSLHINNKEFAVSRNLDLAIEKLGTVKLKAGQTFSLNEKLGPRTPDLGYKKARVFSGTGEAISEFGGGMCIISTMLYNLFLKAGLEIKERHPHMRTVTYAPAGLDAAIDFGSKDLGIHNNLNQNITIVLFRQGRILKGYLHLEKPIDFEIELRRHVSDAATISNKAFRVRTTRSFFKKNMLIREEILSEDTFKRD